MTSEAAALKTLRKDGAMPGQVVHEIPGAGRVGLRR
jgi:hypothetical protein